MRVASGRYVFSRSSDGLVVGSWTSDSILLIGRWVVGWCCE
jgi:hypothetical protein